MTVRHDVSNDGAVHTITLDAPPGNVIDMAMCRELDPAIAAAADDRAGKVLVLRAAGNNFSFGASVEEHLPDVAPTMLAGLGAVIRALVHFPYPTVVGVQGSCLGGGLELVLACGIVIAEESAKLACPEIQLGVMPPAATALLGAQGRSRLAEDILLTGRTLRTGEAERVGLVNVIAPDGELDETITGYVERHFVPRSASALRIATAAIRDSYAADVDARLAEAERIYVEEVLATHDGVEGIQAFLDKRSPVWRHG